MSDTTIQVTPHGPLRITGAFGISDGTGAATEFQPTEHLSIKEVRRADRFTQFAIVSGDEALAARDTGVLRLQFLPLVVNGILANVDPDRVESYRKYMEAMYPVSGVEVSVGPELEAYYAVSANGGGWDVTLQQVAQRHQNDDAPNDIYYYGLMEPAATLGQYCGYGCVAGIGFDATCSLVVLNMRASSRVSIQPCSEGCA